MTETKETFDVKFAKGVFSVFYTCQTREESLKSG